MQKANPRDADWLFEISDPPGGSGKKVDRAGLLDRVVDFAMKLGGNSGDAAGKDFPGFSRELGEKLRIGCDDEIGRDIVTTTRHLTVRLAEVDAALDCFWLGHGKLKLVLAEFAVKGTALEEVVEFHFLETSRRAEALFVTCGDVA